MNGAAVAWVPPNGPVAGTHPATRLAAQPHAHQVAAPRWRPVAVRGKGGARALHPAAARPGAPPRPRSMRGGMPGCTSPHPGLDLSREYGGAAAIPKLTAFRFTAAPDAVYAYIYDSAWNYLAQLKYRSVRVSDSVVVFTSLNWFPSTPAMGYAAYIRQNSLVPGVTYDLQYYLDCTPDVDGYVEAWTTCYRWTQPNAWDLAINDSVVDP